MNGLLDFLCAQIDEDERVATNDGRLRGDQWTAVEISPTRLTWEVVGVGRTVAQLLGWEARHAARHDPARVLREVEAKRRILDLHLRSHDNVADRLGFTAPDMCAVDAETYPCRTVRLIALPYADQPGFREEWRP